MIWQAFLITLIVYLCVRRWRLRKLINLGNKLKSDISSLPLIGHAHHFIGDNEVHMNMLKRFGQEANERENGMTSIWLGDILFLVVADPELLDILLKVYIEKGDMMRFVRFLTGNGSIFAPVSIWKPRRKIIIPTFSPKNLNNFVEIFAKQSVTMVKKLKNTIGEGPFSLWPFMTTYTMDSVCESTLGVTVNAQENPNHPFLLALDEVTRLLVTRIVKPWCHSDMVYKLTPAYRKMSENTNTLHEFIYEIIKSKRASMENVTRKITDDHKEVDEGTIKTFLELLIDQSSKNQSFTDLELMEEILVLVMAGTDTSAVGSCFTALMLASHPQIQDKIYDELQEVFGDSTRPVIADDLPRLKYLDAVIRETLRLYPPVPVTIRKTDREYILPNGLKIEKGCELLSHNWAAHRNPRYWGEDAELFRPERFIDTPLKHPAQFMPFSYGPRNCVGYQYAMMSMKTALATLLRTYRILPESSEVAIQSEQNTNPKPDFNEISVEKAVANEALEIKRPRNGLEVKNAVDKTDDKENFTNTNATNGKVEHFETENSHSIKNEDSGNLNSKNNVNGNLINTKAISVTKPLRVYLSIMMKDINNFTIQLEDRKKVQN